MLLSPLLHALVCLHNLLNALIWNYKINLEQSKFFRARGFMLCYAFRFLGIMKEIHNKASFSIFVVLCLVVLFAFARVNKFNFGDRFAKALL
jgi:hypothetical protein